jgi:DNA-damage-inducible protein J
MDAIIKSRIDLELKTEVERVLSSLGLTVSDAIRMTFKQIAARQGLPFDVKIPNAQTQAAMRDADAWVVAMRAGTSTAPIQSKDDLFKELSTSTPIK